MIFLLVKPIFSLSIGCKKFPNFVKLSNFGNLAQAQKFRGTLVGDTQLEVRRIVGNNEDIFK